MTNALSRLGDGFYSSFHPNLIVNVTPMPAEHEALGRRMIVAVPTKLLSALGIGLEDGHVWIMNTNAIYDTEVYFTTPYALVGV